MLKFLILFICFLSFLTINAQQVTNIQVTQDGDKVVITYDISVNQAGQTFDIKVECSVDGGKTFSIFPQSITGDLKGINVGARKQIIWDVLNDGQDLTGEQFVFQLVAKVNNPVDSFVGNSGTFTDSRDGHVYKWVKIGTQIWMAENLAYLPWVNLPLEGSKSTPRYYVYGYNGINKEIAKAMPNFKTYGVLYNWAAGKVACPEGWHIPNADEWEKLLNFLGGENVAGGKLKETGKTNWKRPNTGATDEIGFSALPGGNRTIAGSFGLIGKSGDWWCYDAWHLYLYYNSRSLYKIKSYFEDDGFSVRCVKDSN